jgi:hypothetical protein
MAKSRSHTVWTLALLASGLVIVSGCSSGGPPTPTLQTSSSGIDSKKQLDNIENDKNMPDLAKSKREKVLKNRISQGMP